MISTYERKLERLPDERQIISYMECKVIGRFIYPYTWATVQFLFTAPCRM
jgi:hypothetical protein